MKRYIIYLFVLLLMFMLGGCTTEKASDIVVNESKFSQTTKKDNPYRDKIETNTATEELSGIMEKNAIEHFSGVYGCNDILSISSLEITVKDAKQSKKYDCVESEAADYFKSEWIQKGSLSNYNTERMSLVYVYVNVKNNTDNVIECPIGMASLGNYYNDNKYYRLTECAAVYPSSYERTTHCLFDEMAGKEEKTYVLLFKVFDQYENNDGSYSECLVNPCLELGITSATQGKNAPLVILTNILKE